MKFFKLLLIIYIIGFSSVSNSIAQIKKPNNANLNASILNKLIGRYFFDDGFSTQDLMNFKIYSIIITLEYDKINGFFKSKINRQVTKRESMFGPIVNFIIDGSQSNGRYNLNIKDTSIDFSWIKKQKLELKKAIIETDYKNGDTLLVFSDSVKFRRTHKIENGNFIEVKQKLIIEGLEILQSTFRNMNFSDAKDFVNKLGNGWKLPNKEELNIIYLNRNKNDKLRNFINFRGSGFETLYWSSTDIEISNKAFAQDFEDGLQFEGDKEKLFNVLAIRY